jgi:aconitate hydratase
MPAVFLPGQNAASLGLTGDEVYDIEGIGDGLKPNGRLQITATKPDGSIIEFEAIARIDSTVELDYYRNGGILQTVLRRLTAPEA